MWTGDAYVSTHFHREISLSARSRGRQIREAVLLSFADPVPDRVEELFYLSNREWKQLLHWLDISGLALYMFDRFAQLGVRDALPPWVVDRLHQNLDDNRNRTRGMIEESIALQQEFQDAGLSYAVMKGLSLCPISVVRPELRHQCDLDYLIAEDCAPEARGILERRGYRLYAISGSTWEFKINETPCVSLRDLYKDLPSYAVELHLESEAVDRPSRLNRIVNRTMFGMTMPVFSPVDLFLGQGLHAFKDVCSSFSRTAHLLEFYRHVLTLRDDEGFWNDLRTAGGDDRRTSLGIGVVTYLLTSVLGDFAPQALKEWTVDALPASIRLWSDLYGRRAMFGKHPGTKLYLLLQRELEIAGVKGMRPVRNSLLPSRLPPTVIRPSSNETFATRVARLRLQSHFVLGRLRFHLVEGLRYAFEAYRWQRRLNRLSSVAVHSTMD
jgi:hypothetical protein